MPTGKQFQQSMPDRGAPLAPPYSGVTAMARHVRAFPPKTAREPMSPFSVLVIEDDAMIAVLLAEMLGEMGYDVCAIAATEDAAVADAARFNPSLMIVDEQLLEGSGVSAVERIHRTGPVPCVFISGGPPRKGRTGTTILQKPFLEADLVRAICHVVGGADALATPASAPRT